MPRLAEQAIEQAILAIEAFLAGSVDDPGAASATTFRELSLCIQRAKFARGGGPTQDPSGPTVSAVCERYRRSLERLQARLEEIEMHLTAERNRLLDDHSGVARVREWNLQLSRTQ
jgi:hypothetical protein